MRLDQQECSTQLWIAFKEYREPLHNDWNGLRPIAHLECHDAGKVLGRIRYDVREIAVDREQRAAQFTRLPCNNLVR